MKKAFLILGAISLLSLIFVFFAAHTAYAQTNENGFVALAPIPGLTEGGAADSDDLADFFNNLYKYLIGLAAAFAVIEIIWGGLEISTKDSVSKQSDGRNRITQAIFGLILVLSPVLVFSIINPSILNLSINIPALDTKQLVEGEDDPRETDLGNECAPVGSSLPLPGCPAGQVCEANANNKYVCHSTACDFILPEVKASCPEVPLYQNWCPSGAPAYDECWLTGEGSFQMALCTNLNEASCNEIKKGPTRPSDIPTQ